jgi:pyridoxamine 5'-phosphate oxidase
VRESADDIAGLQTLLDRSYANAGRHLLSIHTPERRLSAGQLCQRLTGMRLLTLATTSADGRPFAGPVDGIFYRGSFYFGSSADSLRYRHIRVRPEVSAAHVPGEELAVTVHGQAVPIDVRSDEQEDFRQTLFEVYVPRYGDMWEKLIETGLGEGPPVYARIEAVRMFAFFMPSADAPAFAQPLLEEAVDPDPLAQFAAWFRQAGESGVRVPEAAALATSTPDGAPSARMVLVKEHGSDGFVFYTNFESRKGHDLSANPRAALLFYWDPLGRQVRIEGQVERLSGEESAPYIRSRPRSSQLSALASPQSQLIEDRRELERLVAELTARLADQDPPLPERWGGFRLTPESFEFWQHREDRLHDRLLYRLAAGGGWRLERLAP